MKLCRDTGTPLQSFRGIRCFVRLMPIREES